MITCVGETVEDAQGAILPLRSRIIASSERMTVSQHRKRLERRVESGPRSGSEAFSIWGERKPQAFRGRGDRGWELWRLNAIWGWVNESGVSHRCRWW